MKIKFTEGALEDMERLFSDSWRYSIPRWFNEMYYEIKYGFQRMFRGYDDKMLWGTYYEISKIMIEVLKWNKEHKQGYGYIEELGIDASIEDLEKKWNEIYDRMIVGFKIIIDDERLIPLPEDEAKIKDALELFAKYFRNLWD
jgi:hypothetical protein